jgi:hypothetical protein
MFPCRFRNSQSASRIKNPTSFSVSLLINGDEDTRSQLRPIRAGSRTIARSFDTSWGGLIMARTSCCATRGFHGWFAWKYWWRGCPRCGAETRQRQSIRFEVEPLDRRESPTSLLFSGSVTASLFAMHPPVSAPPALVQTQTSFVPISIASETASDNFPAGSASASFGAGSVSDGISSAQTQGTDASRLAAENWAAFSTVDDLFPDAFALDPALASKPHSGGASSAGASEDVHPHSSSNDGGSTTGGGGGFSSGNSGAFFGAENVGDRSQGNALSGLFSNGSSAPSAPVAHAPGSAIGAPALPTNILLAPTIPLTTHQSPLTNSDYSSLITHNSSLPNTTGSGHGSGDPIATSPQGGLGPDACANDNDTTANVLLPCGSPATVVIIDCPT